MKELVWLIPVLPLLGAFLNGVVLRNRLSKKGVGWVALGAVWLSCLLAFGAVASYVASSEHAAHQAFEKDLYSWIDAGAIEVAGQGIREFSVPLGFMLDPLACIMVLFVTFVGALIHIYSVGYMAHEEGYQRFFTYLNLFMGAMLTLVLANSYLVMFVGWEGVGLCSYLLIGFYFEEEFPPFAGRKAFLVNRIGDLAFLLALFALAANFGSLKFTELFASMEANVGLAESPYVLGLSVAGFIALCLFIGATGKSAQIPLFVWLPDAMAGPTPVSALIHAATMVTAGVYLVVRSNLIFQLAPDISSVVAIIGCATALMAATIGLVQTDIKKVLAYSTISQLGFMFLACGVGAYVAAIFHVFTHAFFKALLFLGSGSVIHAMGGEQDMRQMGGLKQYLPVTYRTFVVGAIAIAGIPPLAGFFSKDEILTNVFLGQHYVLWGVGLFVAGLTALYMFRVVHLTFHGEFRGTAEQRNHLHESPAVMTLPLIMLAAGAIVAGLLGIPAGMTFNVVDWNLFQHFLEPVIAHVGTAGEHAEHLPLTIEWLLIVVSVGVAVVGIVLATRYYGGGRALSGGEQWAKRLPWLHSVFKAKYWVDELYDATLVQGTWRSARQLFRFDAGIIDGFFVMGARHLTVTAALLSGFFDKYFVDGLVNLVAWILSRGSTTFRRFQTGLVSQYALVLVVGVFVLVFAVIVFV